MPNLKCLLNTQLIFYLVEDWFCDVSVDLLIFFSVDLSLSFLLSSIEVDALAAELVQRY